MATSLQPQILSLNTIRNNITNVFVARSGVNDLNEGSSVRDFIEGTAMSDYRTQGSIIAILNSLNIDRAINADLDKIGFAAGVSRPQATTASGVVTIGSNNFNKISTQIYPGTAAPPAGVSLINISDGSAFPQSGAIYLGRGTPNLEGPLAFNAVIQIGTFYQITLVNPTTKNHNTSETVILAQGGNRVVSAGGTVQTMSNETSPATVFVIAASATVPDGEQSITNVPVTCTQPGTVGNVAANSITQFGSSAFPGAFVTNPTAFVSGQASMSDTDYRNLIKTTAQTRQKGTPLAIETAAIGVTSTDDNKTCTSSSYRAPANRNEPGVLFLASGIAYEPVIYGQGFEPIIDNANGSEKYLQLENEDITKATLISTYTAPFALTGGMALAVNVGGVLSQHVFESSDFATQNAAATDEIVTSINNDVNLLFSARAVNNDTQISLFAEAFMNDDLQIETPVAPNVDANQFLGFSENHTYSLKLYENDILLYKDGIVPMALSTPQSQWNPVAFVGGATLIMAVDGTPSITLTFQNTDFIPYGYSTVATTNSLASWVALINQKMGGITAAVDGDQLQIVDNKGAVTGASLQVVGGTLVTGGNMFTAAFYEGQSSDYALNRSTGQFELAKVMPVGATLTAGSQNTKGFVSSTSFSTGSVGLVPTANDTVPRLFLILDAPAQQIVVNISSTSTITVTNTGDAWTYTSSVANAFSNVMVGDWALIESENIPDSDNNKGFWRVSAVTATSITIEKIAGTDTVYTASGTNDINIIRSAGQIQEVDFGTGTQTLGALIQSVGNYLVGGFAQVQGATTLMIVTNTYGLNGSVFVAGFNSPASVLGYVIGDFDQSTVSHTAFAESGNSELTIPEFIHDFVTADNGVLPPPVVDRTIMTNSSLSTYIPPERFIAWLNAYARESNNEGTYQLTGQITGTSVLVRGNNEVRDIITNDRYFVAQPFNFSGEDNLVAIIDNDPVNKSLNIPFYRNGVVSNQTPPTSTTFTAYDTDNGPTSNYVQSFGNNYNFQDFKVLFMARQILTPAGANNEILLRYYKFGPTGNQVQVGIFYPTAPNTPVSGSAVVGAQTQINISLASDVSKVGGWSNTSQFNVTNTSGNTWRYTWNGTGTAPNFTSAVPSPIAIGDIVTIAATSNFMTGNKGTYRITNVSAAYFEITNLTGVIDSNVQLNVASDFTFYALLSASNTGTAIITYINANLANYITATNALGSSGAGIISTSTFDDTASSYVQLVDGENWLYSSNIGTTFTPTNAFTLKVARSLPNSSYYSFVGEPFRFVPATSNQLSSFLNVFAVTGLSSLANLDVSSKAGKIQIYSNLFGSAGAVQITGGLANSVEAAVLSSALVVNSNYTAFDINTTDSAGIIAGQWALIENTSIQNKVNSFSPSTQLQITAATPSTGFAKIVITTGPGTFQTARSTSADNTTQIKVERQGQFTAFSWTGTGTAPNFMNVQEGDWVVITGAFNVLNQGTFRVIKLYGTNTIYIQNNSSIEEEVTMSGNADLTFYSYDSVMPGDQIVIENNVLGAANNGVYTVVYVPAASVPYPTPSTIYVSSTTLVNAGPTALGTGFNEVLINEQSPWFAYRKIQNIAVDPANPKQTLVVVNGTALSSKININAGSNISLVSKLGFNNLINTGEDSYKYYGGVIHAVGQVIRGEPTDPVTLPGVAAAGSYLELDIALPLPLQLSIVIRTLTGTPFVLLQSRVQSAVAAYVNALGVNTPVVFSQIIQAANSVSGVQAVSIAAPEYDSTHDIITVQPNEQAAIENATTDVVVSLAT